MTPIVREHHDSSLAAADLLQAALGLASDLDLPTVLQRFVQASADLTGARYAAINVLDARGRSTTFVHTGVDEQIAALLGRAPHSTGVLAAIPPHGTLRLTDLTEHPDFQGLPSGHPRMGAFLGTAVRVRDRIFGHLYLSEKSGGFTSEDDEAVITLAAAAAVAIQNAQLYGQAAHREEWLRAGQTITTMLLQGADEEEVLLEIARSSRQVARADTAALVLPSLGDTMVMEIVDGVGAEELLGTVMPPDGRARTVLRDGNGLVVDSLSRARAMRVAAMRQFGPAMYAPMHADGRGVGVLVLLRRVGSPQFDPSDLATAESYAGQAAIALVLAEARHAQDVAALLDERERIARDLHDLAIQQLFATGMQLETVRRRAARGVDPAELTGIVEDALDNVDSTVRQIRSIVHALRDPDASAPLAERLRREASLARTGLGFAPSLVIHVDGRVLDSGESLDGDAGVIDDRVGEDMADDIVAVVREGLANAARHARASSVAVLVALHGDAPSGRITVEVQDDGTGLPDDRERRSGTDNLAARARRHGGEFTLGTTSEGRGTLLTWQAPVKGRAR
ncbi:GAF domain-containing sensor histidine kinase [Cellulomonas bogoriensis]|uniref:Histidine kinase n=1 Tax=Cellulomonas bogoriensis 69B4 = DSM 16987 TaxID=1386082 RepID=A0A0A0BXG2_9CELL|nr:GAF domain-containing protein [Cellulomonas bogoriensis]KGM13093.1 histidine kinase [Cellulomonas bogoriensis 69B4 = DSM 16987]